MSPPVNDLLLFDFHEKISSQIYSLKELFIPFLGPEDHLLINATKFPNMEIKVLHPKEIIKTLSKELTYEYISYCIAYKSVVVYVYSEEDCLFFCQENEEDKLITNINKAQEETSFYLKAYENGLLKEAYTKAKNTLKPVIFTILNGDAKLLDLEQAKEIINNYKEFFPEIEEWEFLATDEELNPSLVSFLYIDSNTNIYWYDILSEEYENWLQEKWNK